MHPVRALAIATFSFVLAAASLAGLSSASSGTSGGSILRFSTYPKRTLPGKTVSVAITGPTTKDVCSLTVRYAGGPLQPGLRSITVGARRTVWTWKVPENAPPGSARVSVACKHAGKLSGLLEVAEPPLPIDVAEQGFSLRSKFGRGDVSYGVVLANHSKREDALDVFVVVNFVNASNVLIGSESTNLDAIPAGTQYNHGGSVSFPGAAPVDHVEVVVKVGDRQPASHVAVPAISNIRIVPSQNDPTWVDEVDADMLNAAPDLMTRARLSVVLFNAAGAVVGGGIGSSSGSLPAKARQFVKVSSDVDSVPIADAVSAQITVVPSYESD
jgi:hypothetical protein